MSDGQRVTWTRKTRGVSTIHVPSDGGRAVVDSPFRGIYYDGESYPTVKDAKQAHLKKCAEGTAEFPRHVGSRHAVAPEAVKPVLRRSSPLPTAQPKF